MGLPPKSYFHLDEIAQSWGASMSDLACYTLDGLIEISVMAIGARVETGRFEMGERGLFRVPEGEKLLNGPQPVVPSDLWSVFRSGAGLITRFKPATSDGFVDLAPEVCPIQVRIADLLVTRRERQRFEFEHGLCANASPEQQLEKEIRRPAFLHSDNYAEVVLNGEVFRLGPLQASIIRELHKSAQSGRPWRHGKELLSGCEAQTMRLVDLFKAKCNWRTLIASDGRGYYRLNIPDQAAMRPAHRAYRRLRLGLPSTRVVKGPDCQFYALRFQSG